MTKSAITREQLEEWVAQFDEDGGCDATDRELEALIRQSLAAMDRSESVELPLDYLQGHKDGLEWAAQLAKANHPETGDWLYDDPIELAKAIRKGPDMPPEQPVADSEPVYQVFEPSDGRWVDIDDEEEMIRLRSIGGETRTLYTAPPSTVVDGEPVAWRWRWSDDAEGYWRYTEEQREAHGSVTAQPLYRHAQPAPERDQVRNEHAEWSQATFGNVGPVGPLKHLSKEALEAAAEPDDLSEWADMQFLLWDAQRRAGITDEQITQAMIEKLAVNKQRSWPEPKDGEPRLHVKEQPAPVVPDERAAFNAWNNEDNLPIAGVGAKNAAWLAWQARAKLAGNSPVIPDGYVMVPKEVTLEIGNAINEVGHHCTCGNCSQRLWDLLLAAAPQEVNHG